MSKRDKESMENTMSDTRPITSKAMGSAGDSHYSFTFDERKKYSNDDLARITLSGFRSVITQLTQIRGEIHEIKTILQSQKSYCPDTRGTFSDENFSEKYGFSIPFETLDDFLTFDKDLKSSDEFRKDFKLNMWTSIDTSMALVRSLTSVLKKYLVRDLALKFTAVKKVDGKILFKNTTICSCIKGNNV
ncbi:uncharacterized protein [Linepithema humile]|uniref:uncharacterized protein n=1 Tax=Linepithema humile TaxID=83485 RepID=UPI00351F5C87